MSEGAATNGQAGRVEFANSLRGLAAVSVLVAHLVEAFWMRPAVTSAFTGIPPLAIDPPWFARLVDSSPISFAGFGVGLFFVISGFVIPFSFERYDGRAFLIGRLLRIYPTYWAGFSISVAALVIGSLVAGSPLPFDFGQAALHYVPPLRAILNSKAIDGIIWTLEIELFFYLLCATLAVAFAQGRRRIVLAPFLLFAVWLVVYAFVGRPPAGLGKIAQRVEFVAVYLPFLVFMFAGVALNFRQRGLIERSRAALWVAACVAMFLTAWATKFLGAGWKPLFVGVIDPASYLSALALFVAAMWGQDFFRSHPVFRFAADISYPLYIVHGLAGFVMLQIMVGRGVEAHVALIVAVVAVFVAAWLLHRFVEAPTHRIGQRLARGVAGKKVAG